MTAHSQATASAQKTVDALGVIFDNIRSGGSPIWSAYRTLIRAGLSADTIVTLLATISDFSRQELARCLEVGLRQAERDTEIFGVDPRLVEEDMGQYVNLITSMVTVQTEKARLAQDSGVNEEIIIGGDDRVGIINPTPIISEVILWGTTISALAYTASMVRSLGAEPRVVSQAVAVVDDITTETCLNVHGQTTNKYFTLTGTPRYSDRMTNPPFHKGCRTAVLIIPTRVLDNAVTERMQVEAEEQKRKPRPSSVKVKYRVYGMKVREFRNGKWRNYRSFKTNFEARKAAASLNNARRS